MSKFKISRVDLSRFTHRDVYGTLSLHIGGQVISEYAGFGYTSEVLGRMPKLGIECTTANPYSWKFHALKTWGDGEPKVVAIPDARGVLLDASCERIVPVDRSYTEYDHKALYCRRQQRQWQALSASMRAMPGEEAARKMAGIKMVCGSFGRWQDSPTWESDAVEVSPGLFCTVSVPTIGSLGTLAMTSEIPPIRPAIYTRGSERHGDTRLRDATEEEFAAARAAVDRYVSLSAAATAAYQLAFGDLTPHVADDVAVVWGGLWEYWATVAHYGSPSGVFGYVHCRERAAVAISIPPELMPAA